MKIIIKINTKNATMLLNITVKLAKKGQRSDTCYKRGDLNTCL